eukprot:scaffold74687_cov56-Phaeocystis_antarctica.AAC.1
MPTNCRMTSSLTSTSPRMPARTASSSAAWSTTAPSSSAVKALSSSAQPQVDGSEPAPDTEPIVAALNSGAGDDGEAAAPTHFSTQRAASHLIRRVGITCGADHAVRGPKGMRSAPNEAEVYSRA